MPSFGDLEIMACLAHLPARTRLFEATCLESDGSEQTRFIRPQPGLPRPRRLPPTQLAHPWVAPWLIVSDQLSGMHPPLTGVTTRRIPGVKGRPEPLQIT